MSVSIEAARALLARNDRGGYTVPTDGLYPFQWNWDSAFVAWGFATHDVDRALAELEALASGQGEDGFIPHIVFHADADSYFPGPEVWRTSKAKPRTSGITQPPVFATALRAIEERGADRARVAALYRVALANHRWWAAARDPGGTGLVAILHNWESGRDNNPAWDGPFERVPETTTTTIQRRDTGHVDPSMRPTDQEYRRYIHLVDRYAGLGWDPARMWADTPFKVADVGINAILIAAEADLAILAGRHGTPAERREIEARRERMTAAMASLWHEGLGQYVSRDLMSGRLLDTPGSGGFLPLLTDAPGADTVERMAVSVETMLARGIHPVPSTFPGAARFDARRYWRGPVWAVVNWMIARGFDRHGRGDLGARIDGATRALIERHGFAENFDPLTGEGLGGGAFSWTAAIYLLIAERQRRAA
jgi:hypothetical protein